MAGCELHVHLGGCFYVEDLLAIGEKVYRDVDWTLYRTNAQRTFGESVDPVVLFEQAIGGGDAVKELRRRYVLGPKDGGDFSRFVTKFSLLSCLYRHLVRHGLEPELVRRVAERHRSEGMDYVEYRAMYPHGTEDADGFSAFHRLNATELMKACDGSFIESYIISLPRWQPVECFRLVEKLLRESPELSDVIVGLDFCHIEEGFPPKLARPLFDLIDKRNDAVPDHSLGIVYHVGESYFDKTVESAIRWCHAAALMGSRRLGHAIALGLDPAVAVNRRPRAHETELVSERLDQIAYDLGHIDELRQVGVDTDEEALHTERRELNARKRTETFDVGPYGAERLEQIRRRQQYVLSELATLGTVVESCPTSNRLIAAIADPADHPVRRLLGSDVSMAIGADDPGIFDSPLASEVAWVAEHSGMSRTQLEKRLGDPRRFRLG